MKLTLNPYSIDDYQTFVRIKALPKYRFVGSTAEFPDEYGDLLGVRQAPVERERYKPLAGLFDYQRDIAAMAIQKRKFAAFVDMGLGKSLIETEFARHASGQLAKGRATLIVTPLMVVSQMREEIARFYGDSLPVRQVRAAELADWLTTGTDAIGITNYESLRDDVPQGRLGALIADESSVMKSAGGKWARTLIRLGRGLEWKLAATGTPAPNDRIEFANHAVFLDAFPTTNSFLARFFVNRGQTDNRWELKPHALEPFYRALSHWSIFLTNPATYGWKDNAGTLPPIHVHIHEVNMSDDQRAAVRDETGDLFGLDVGGITRRSTLSQIAKGNHRGKKMETHKPGFIRRLVDSWPDESTIIWAIYNKEQDTMEAAFPEAGSIRGDTPLAGRQRIIADFKSRKIRVLISKAEVLGYGLNLQVATRQVFSGLEDSYESFVQAVKRSNRVGSTLPLNVHIPVTAAERPMVDTVLVKARRVQQDGEEQEAIFKRIKETVNAIRDITR